MSRFQESSRLAWLSASLNGKRNRIADLLRRMTGMGTVGGMKSPVFHKFLGLLDQVANDKEKEIKIINQIEAIEQKHKFQRKHAGLKQATPQPKQNLNPELEAEEPKPTPLWLWVLTLMALAPRPKN